MSTIYSGEVGAHPPHPPLLPSLPSPPCPSTPSRIGLGAGWVGLFAVSVLTAALAATAPVVDPSVVKFSAREAAASFAPEHVLAVVLAEWELCRAEGERSPAFPRRRSRGRPFQPCMGRGPTPLWRTVMVCVDERLFHAPIAPQFVKSENGVSYVGCDFPCVTAEEALNHRTDHGDKFSLLPSCGARRSLPPAQPPTAQLHPSSDQSLRQPLHVQGSRRSCGASHRPHGLQ